MTDSPAAAVSKVMALTDHLRPERIRLNFAAEGKAQALAALSRFAAEGGRLSAGEALAVITAREALGSTGIGGGVALPHGRLPGLAEPVLVLALAPGGVEFDSLDGWPVRVLALVLTGEEGQGQQHLQLLARLGAVLKSPEAVAELAGARTEAEVLAFFSRFDQKG